MSGLEQDSTFDEIDRLVDNEEFRQLMQRSSGESGETNLSIDLNAFSPLSVNVSPASSLPITPGLLDTAFLNVSNVLFPWRYQSRTTFLLFK